MKTAKRRLPATYEWMYSMYGSQGWWPVLDCAGCNPTKTGSMKGYHPGDYSYPKNEQQQFEICVGAILTQNTAWTNVERALQNCRQEGVLHPKKLYSIKIERVKELIRPAGYYNQKAGYIRNFLELYLSLEGRVPSRNQLLECKGIGNETADSMLLYAFSQPEFVIDAYTKRIFSHLGFITPDEHYMKVKAMFETCIKRDVCVYQEFHALIVEHAKQYYTRKPYGERDPLIQALHTL